VSAERNTDTIHLVTGFVRAIRMDGQMMISKLIHGLCQPMPPVPLLHAAKKQAENSTSSNIMIADLADDATAVRPEFG
jgi:hypothetical protein